MPKNNCVYVNVRKCQGKWYSKSTKVLLCHIFSITSTTHTDTKVYVKGLTKSL